MAIKHPQHDLPPDLLNSRLSGASAIWGDDSGLLLLDDFFVAEATGEITGSMAATEASSPDVLAASGTVTDPTITGSMAVTESSTPDTLAASGTVRVSGGMAVTESATADTLASTGTVRISGSMAVTESATPDTFAAGGTVTDPWITGSMAVTESATPDTLAAIGQVRIQGSAAIAESGVDTMASTGQVRVIGSAALTETGVDTLLASGTVRVSGSLAATETGVDTLASLGTVRVSGAMAVTEDSAPDILYAWSQKQAQVAALLSLASEAEAAGFKGAAVDFLIEAAVLISGNGIPGVSGIAEILLSDLVEIQAATDRFVDAEILEHGQIHINFFSHIQGLEKFAVYQDVRRRVVDLDCIIQKKVR